MYGTTMMARIRPADSKPLPPTLGPPPRSNRCCSRGPRNVMPQKPYTTLGIAASSSTRKEPVRLTQPVAISAKNVAVPTPNGTARSMASAEVMTEP